MSTAAPAPDPRPRSSKLLWIAGFLIVIAVLSNALFFVKVPGQHLLPWLNLLLFALPLVAVIGGLRRTVAQPRIYRGRTAGWLLMGLSGVLFAFSVFALYVSRNIPDASAAPQVGQAAPDFTLPDSSGQTVALHDVLLSPMANGAPPKAVLLVFYRGYW
ncbi:MAG TPA: hypothetical protein VJN64_05615 [Terriglobales bacterium]|nr:hypothetical protein [Terriglobales bacterium]